MNLRHKLMLRGFRNNSNLMPSGYKHEYTKHELDEFMKCKNDPIYFIKNYVKIINVDKGLIPFTLFPFQEKMINSYHDNDKTIVLSARQIGKSATAAAYICWYIIFNNDVTAAILANKEDTAKEIMSRVQLTYEHLPHFLKRGVVSWAKKSIEIDGNCKVICGGTSSSAIRGKSINLLFMDEFAFVARNLADEFFTSVYPTISSGTNTKLIMCSTPNGYNHFYEFWNEAEKGENGFNPVFVNWDEVPGRDEAWRLKQLKVLGEHKFKQEFLAEFLGSTNTLINPAILKSISSSTPIFERDSLKVYKTPEKKDEYGNGIDRQYMLVADVAEGKDLDSSAFIVYDITEYPITIAAVYKDATIQPLNLPIVIEAIAKKYNDAYVLVETNSVGRQVADSLYQDFEYENLIMTKNDVGVRTTQSVRRIGCFNLKELVEGQKLLINDEEFKRELYTFSSKNGKYQAEADCHDDLVMCGVLFAWFAATEQFKELTDMDVRRKVMRDNSRMIEDDMMPMGFVVNGLQDDDSYYMTTDDTDYGESYNTDDW